MYILFQLCLLSIMLLSSLMVITAKNPVESVLFLILVFLNAAGFLLLIEAEFIALIFLVIYVGAIAVLFLFIVMMLDIKIQRGQSFLIQYAPFGLLFGGLFFLEIFISLESVFSSQGIQTEPYSWYCMFDNLSNIEVLGQILYKEFLFCFLISGILLLIAMIGAIVLTLNFTSYRKNEIIVKQISRKPSDIVNFI